MAKNSRGIPPVRRLLWPSLEAVREHGDFVAIEEHDQAVAEKLRLNDDQLALLHGKGPETEFRNRMKLARTYLKGIGTLEKSSRGDWVLTDLGRRVGKDEVMRLQRALRKQVREARTAREAECSEGGGDAATVVGGSWTYGLLRLLEREDHPGAHYQHVASLVAVAIAVASLAYTATRDYVAVEGPRVYLREQTASASLSYNTETGEYTGYMYSQVTIENVGDRIAQLATVSWEPLAEPNLRVDDALLHVSDEQDSDISTMHPKTGAVGDPASGVRNPAIEPGSSQVFYVYFRDAPRDNAEERISLILVNIEFQDGSSLRIRPHVTVSGGSI
jgi:hypothetical protein